MKIPQGKVGFWLRGGSRQICGWTQLDYFSDLLPDLGACRRFGLTPNTRPAENDIRQKAAHREDQASENNLQRYPVCVVFNDQSEQRRLVRIIRDALATCKSEWEVVATAYNTDRSQRCRRRRIVINSLRRKFISLQVEYKNTSARDLDPPELASTARSAKAMIDRQVLSGNKQGGFHHIVAEAQPSQQ
ncbi:hypothetical protein Pcac1_g27180 [Phytophthora cactorum]|nr:hypothetical protein Pcac1_g27180 [Phytophthora cactorum]KAG2823922.1 hypothetical protein PC112_g10312 [Phytophthora cactorum]KAG3016040.1 hypothetical protein PC119_g11504 [Phytophthora cactorum]KAG3070867.1 hypothetical protein PC122_g15928 [Phytophthora cactorum]